MDNCHLTRSPSISSFDTNHSSWSFVGEDDFDLLDHENDGLASEDEIDEIDEVDDQVEGEDDDSADDDDISVLTEEDVLNDSSTLGYRDVNRISEQLDQLSKCFDSPYTHMLENFTLERNIRFMAIIFAATIAIVIFYSLFGIGKPESLSFTSTENTCFIDEERFLGLQHRDAASSFLRPFFETLLKPSISAFSLLPSNIPKLHANEPFSWIFNSESIRASQDDRGYFAKNECERVSTKHQFSAMNEAVRRCLRLPKKLAKPCRYASSILPNINETPVNEKNTETRYGKLQMDLQKPSSLSKPTLPISPFSANHLSIEPKIELLTSTSSSELVVNMPLRKELASVSECITDLVHVEKQCFEVVPDTKKVESLGKKRAKLLHKTDLNSLFVDSKLFESRKLFEIDFEKKVRQLKKGKNGISGISSMKKAISKIADRVKLHHDKPSEQFKKAVNNIAQKNRPKTFRMGEKTNIVKERCIFNSTCNVLASLARTLASISLFPAIVGQTSAAKYINSLLDLSTCTRLRLVCERCWWTRECCPKERCTFLPWQRHFNTKRFLALQGHKMLQAFRELGWSMPEKKRKDSDGKPKFKFDHLNRSAGSEKEMHSRQHKKKSMERYSKKNGVQNRIH